MVDGRQVQILIYLFFKLNGRADMNKWVTVPHVTLMLFCLTLAMPWHAFAQVGEYELKAAFLFNFALFTQPVSTLQKNPVISEPYRICIWDKDPFGASAKVLAARTIAGRRVTITNTNTFEDLKRCQLAFFSDTDREAVRRAIVSIQGLPIITVGESKDFPASGTVFNLVVMDEKVAFQVDTHVARTQQLDVSAKLTRLAKNVR
jgi:hypothetical protein